MEIIDQWKDRLSERKKLLKDRIYKWNLMRKFGDSCPRCGRKLVYFSVHPDCYKKFITLGHRRKSQAVEKRARGLCTVCRQAAGGRRVFCSFCGYYK